MRVVTTLPPSDAPDASSLFDAASILPADPVDEAGQLLEVLHDREYRVRAFRKSADRLLLRGAVRDQKPPGLYLDIDPDPLTIHHMQLDMEVAMPSFEIVDAAVEFLSHPNRECPQIVERYRELIGLSIARGFTHKVRELFGGPRGCTHTTALLQAMAPVAIQSMWSMRAANVRSGATEGGKGGGKPSAEQQRAMWQMNLNTCHVWAEDSEWVASLQAGEEMPPPVFVEERMVSLGLKPEDWRRRMMS